MSGATVSSTANIGTLTDKIALITGASSGLGRAIAQAYAAAGAFIVSADITPNPPDAPLVQELLKETDLKTPTVDLINASFPSGKDGRPRAAFVKCDVTQSASVEAAVAFAVKQYGRLDIMVNNAGISAEIGAKSFVERSGSFPRVHETDPETLDRSWAINGRGVWLGSKYAAAQMLTQPPHQPSGDRGWIINLCSIMGLVGMSGASSYCATKGAVLLMTRAIALEYAKDRIHVNCINPGFTETPLLEPMKKAAGVEAFDAMLQQLHPWGRLGLPSDIAKMAVFLAGDGASWVTGQAFVVDGGYTAQ